MDGELEVEITDEPLPSISAVAGDESPMSKKNGVVAVPPAVTARSPSRVSELLDVRDEPGPVTATAAVAPNDWEAAEGGVTAVAHREGAGELVETAAGSRAELPAVHMEIAVDRQRSSAKREHAGGIHRRPAGAGGENGPAVHVQRAVSRAGLADDEDSRAALGEGGAGTPSPVTVPVACPVPVAAMARCVGVRSAPDCTFSVPVALVALLFATESVTSKIRSRRWRIAS